MFGRFFAKKSGLFMYFALGCGTVAVSCSRAEWPESGKQEIMRMVSYRDFAFDCYASSWAKDNASRLGRLANLGSLGTNAECGFDKTGIKWTVFSDAVNATLRCERDGLIGEYTVTVFRRAATPYGDYFCNAAHFPSSEYHAVGTVTDTLESSE
ncbi:MAG: hypothetical protein ACLFWF_12530 [Alphaproteobacteria bacterium]